MRLLIERDEALKVLSKVMGVVKGKPDTPNGGHVLLNAMATTLSVTTTNGDQQAVDCAAAKVEQPGRASVDARRLHDVFRNLPEGGEVLLALAEDGMRLTVKCGKVNVKLGALPADDFPEFPALDGAAGGALPRDELRRLFSRTRFACSNDETRPEWGGTYLHVREHKGVLWLTAVGLDGKLLAMADMQAPAHFEGFPATILAAAFVDEVSRLLGESPEVVELYASPTLSEFRSGSTEITSKVIEPPYVNYAMAIQRAGGDLVVNIDAGALVTSINRALLIAVDDAKYKTVRLGLSPDLLTISARSPQAGDEMRDEIAIDYAGPAADLSFNASRVKSLFGVIRGETAICAFDAADPKAKGILITDSADPFCRYVLTQNAG